MKFYYINKKIKKIFFCLLFYFAPEQSYDLTNGLTCSLMVVISIWEMCLHAFLAEMLKKFRGSGGFS